MTTKQAADIIRMLLGFLKGEIEPPKQETIEEARAFEQQGYECLEMAIRALERQEKSEYEHDHEVIKAYNDGELFILDMLRKEIELIQVNHNVCEFTIKQILEIIDKYREGFILPLSESEEKE